MNLGSTMLFYMDLYIKKKKKKNTFEHWQRKCRYKETGTSKVTGSLPTDAHLTDPFVHSHFLKDIGTGHWQTEEPQPPNRGVSSVRQSLQEEGLVWRGVCWRECERAGTWIVRDLRMQGTWFLLLSVLGLLHWPGGQAQKLQRVLCDNKDVEAGVDLALVSYNAKLQQGNQFALYQIVGAYKAENDSTTVFTLKFLVRESDCPAGGDRVWQDCDYLPQRNVAPSPCTAVVSRSDPDGGLGIVSVRCKPSVEPVVVASEARCLGCPKVIDVESDELKAPVFYSLLKFNAEDGSSHHFLLRDVVHATRQVVAGFKYDIRFELEKSNCSKEDFKEVTEDCSPAESGPEYARCNSTVYIAPWRRVEPETHLNCERPQINVRRSTVSLRHWISVVRHMMGFGRRKPAGWSPLRHFNMDSLFSGKDTPPTPEADGADPTQPATEPPAPNPTESSEESQEGTSQAAVAVGPSGAPEATPDPALLLPFPPEAERPRPFNCPTKPWKQFVPLPPALPPRPPPPPPPQDDLTEAPEPRLDDALFSDLDLVG